MIPKYLNADIWRHTEKIPVAKVGLNPVIVGRNGCYELTAIGFDVYSIDSVYIDGYGKKDKVINGGFRITVEDMHNLCWAFLEYEKKLQEKLND